MELWEPMENATGRLRSCRPQRRGSQVLDEDSPNWQRFAFNLAPNVESRQGVAASDGISSGE